MIKHGSGVQVRTLADQARKSTLVAPHKSAASYKIIVARRLVNFVEPPLGLAHDSKLVVTCFDLRTASFVSEASETKLWRSSPNMS